MWPTSAACWGRLARRLEMPRGHGPGPESRARGHTARTSGGSPGSPTTPCLRRRQAGATGVGGELPSAPRTVRAQRAWQGERGELRSHRGPLPPGGHLDLALGGTGLCALRQVEGSERQAQGRRQRQVSPDEANEGWARPQDSKAGGAHRGSTGGRGEGWCLPCRRPRLPGGMDWRAELRRLSCLPGARRWEVSEVTPRVAEAEDEDAQGLGCGQSLHAPWCQRSCSLSCSLPHLPTSRNDPRRSLRDCATHSGRLSSASRHVIAHKPPLVLHGYA